MIAAGSCCAGPRGARRGWWAQHKQEHSANIMSPEGCLEPARKHLQNSEAGKCLRRPLRQRACRAAVMCFRCGNHAAEVDPCSTTAANLHPSLLPTSKIVKVEPNFLHCGKGALLAPSFGNSAAQEIVSKHAAPRPPSKQGDRMAGLFVETRARERCQKCLPVQLYAATLLRAPPGRLFAVAFESKVRPAGHSQEA